MKQLLSLALALLPCLAWAQYPSNGNQKITLGEQTTADGLIWRGLAADTTLTAKSDTAAYFVLDTANLNLYTYKASALGRKWRQLGADTAAIAYVNTYGTQTVNGAKTFSAATTFNNTITSTKFIPASGGDATGNGMFLSAANTLGFSTNGTEKLRIASNGRVGIGTTTLTGILNIKEVGAELSIQSDANNVYFEAINRENTALNVDYGFYARNGSHKFWTGSYTERMRLTNDGDLGIGALPPTEKLHVVGNARITGAYNVTTGSAANVFVTTDGVLQRSTSSIKYKMDVEDYNKGINEVMKLRPITYKSINSNNDKIYAGFIAEELADLKLIELYENNDNGEPDAISYAYMVTLLTKAIQQQQNQIDELKKRIINLENK